MDNCTCFATISRYDSSRAEIGKINFYLFTKFIIRIYLCFQYCFSDRFVWCMSYIIKFQSSNILNVISDINELHITKHIFICAMQYFEVLVESM